jgi:AcrR family transcriptional regulator
MSKKSRGGGRGAAFSKSPRPSDPRVERTRRALVQACIELCGEQDFQSLKVADITRRARVNRTTFYLHYEDKTDLLQRGLESSLEEIAQYFRKKPAEVPAGDWLPVRIGHLFSLIEERRAFFRPLLSGSAASLTRERVERFIEEFFLAERIPKSARTAAGAGRLDLPFLATRATVSVLLGLASWWLEHPAAATTKEMTDFYIQFVVGGIKGVGIS